MIGLYFLKGRERESMVGGEKFEGETERGRG